MAYTLQGFENDKVLYANQLIAMENGIIANESEINSLWQFAPQIRNNQPIRKTTDEQIKILCFGSSWFLNTWWYLNKITKSVGVNALIHAYFMSGSALDEWISLYNNENISSVISSSRRAIRNISENGNDWTQYILNDTGATEGYTAQNYRDDWYDDLVNGDWDLILFQQGARQGRDWNAWVNYPDIVSIVKRHCSTDTVIGFNCTWSPAKQHSYLNTYTGKTGIEGQTIWQNQNNTNSQRFMKGSGIDYISPAGTLTWLMRDDTTMNTDSYDLSKDGLHLDYGFPMYGIALLLYEATIAPFYGIPFENCIWVPSSSDQTSINYNRMLEVTDDIKNRLFKYIRLSLSNRFALMSTIGEEEDDTEEDTSGLYNLISYDAQVTASTINETTGEIASGSTNAIVNTYYNIDPSIEYYATSYAPATSGTAACVGYYTSDEEFISSQSGEDFGANSSTYKYQELTVPSNASIIRLFGRTDFSECNLYTLK